MQNHLVVICILQNEIKCQKLNIHISRLPDFEALTLNCLTVKAASEAATTSPNLTIMKLPVIEIS